MKLCFLGNINNMPLIYARELRTMGHEVHFYVDGRARDPLQRPETRYAEYRTYPDWMIDTPVPLPIVAYSFPGMALRSLVQRINSENYDGIVLNGAAISLGTRLSGPKFAILAGSDLDVLCDPEMLDRRGIVKTFGQVSGNIRYPIYRRFQRLQRAGLRSCSGFNYFPKGIHPRGDALLSEIFEGRAPYRLEIRGADLAQLAYSEPSDRRGSDAVILVAVRFLWREPLPAGFSPHENKRNDLIIRGIAQYMKASGKSPKVVLVEKGPDVEASKELASALGIADSLTWLKEMTHAEIFQHYAAADIVFDQLGEHIIGAVGLDAMLTGRPVITNARPEIFDPIIPELSPVCHARTAEDVCAWLGKLVDDPALRKEIGIQSRRYVKRHFDKSDTALAIADHFRDMRRAGQRDIQ